MISTQFVLQKVTKLKMVGTYSINISRESDIDIGVIYKDMNEPNIRGSIRLIDPQTTFNTLIYPQTHFLPNQIPPTNFG